MEVLLQLYLCLSRNFLFISFVLRKKRSQTTNLARILIKTEAFLKLTTYWFGRHRRQNLNINGGWYCVSNELSCRVKHRTLDIVWVLNKWRREEMVFVFSNLVLIDWTWISIYVPCTTGLILVDSLNHVALSDEISEIGRRVCFEELQVLAGKKFSLSEGQKG